MTRRGLAALAALITCGACALSLGNRLYLYMTILLLSALLYALVSCLWAAATLRCGQYANAKSITRGETARVTLRAEHRGLLPVAPLKGRFLYDGQISECAFGALPFRAHERLLTVSARHVGQFDAGLRLVRFRTCSAFSA